MKTFEVSIGAWTRIEAEDEEAAVEKVMSSMNLDYDTNGKEGVWWKDIDVDGVSERDA